jgi:60 kDa SS-A/Ro ribonucleoprotein
MANRSLFAASQVAQGNTLNAEGALAHALKPRQALAQLAMTGCLNQTFYASAQTQLDEVLALCFEVPGEFVAQTAIHARERGRMKDMPALLCAWLASFDGARLESIFNRVIDDGGMLRNFVQILRSGAVARKSLGTRPKRLVQQWLEQASDERLIRAMVGQQPSLSDVIKMVHPRAGSVERAALYGYLIGKDVDQEKLPPVLAEFERFKRDANAPLPKLPFQLLTAQPLTREHWVAIARDASWTTTRMNLNTFARHGVFEDRSMQRLVANRLSDAKLIARARAFPYQLLTAFQAAQAVPDVIRAALRKATELSVANVPTLTGSVAVAVDVSGSMSSPVTGFRQGATTTTRCVDVAGLMAAAILARNKGAMVLPFNDRVRPWSRGGGGVIETAQSLASLLGGGTAVSAPLEQLNRLGFAPDNLIVLSDNQSWIDDRQTGATATQLQWERIKQRNPAAKMVCIDLQPYSNTQVPSQRQVLNVGGFSDAVFEVIAEFSAGRYGADHWVKQIEAVVV